MLEAHARANLVMLQRLAIVLGLLATLTLCALLGFWRMFSLLPPYDDEGCMLITIKQFIDGHALYDHVFSMYGPLPVLVKWMFFAVSGQPVGHDLGRLIALGYWLATAMASGATAWRLTRSLVAGYAAAVLIFLVLWMIISEPGHPQELCALLLVLAVFLATFARPGAGRGPWVVSIGLGVLASCVALTKINIFVFMMMALGASTLAFTHSTRVLSVLTLVYVVCLLAAPAMLMQTHLQDPAIRAYALCVTLSLLPTLIVGFGQRRVAFIGVWHYVGFVGGFTLILGAITTAVLLRGTTLYGLLDGVLLNPLRVGTRFVYSIDWFVRRWPIPVAFTLAAVAWVGFLRSGLSARRRTFAWLVSVLCRVTYGVLFLVWFGGERHNSFEGFVLFALPGAAFLLLRNDIALNAEVDPRLAERLAGEAFARLFLALLAVTESLWAFPVAGSHRSFMCFLPALALIISVVDGFQDLAGCAWSNSRAALAFARLARATVVTMLFLDTASEADAARRYYDNRASLGLNGAEWIRLDPGAVTHYRSLTAALRDRPDTFFTMPGQYSLHFWTERDPLTTLNLTNWMYMLDEQKQRSIVTAMDARPEVCVVVNPTLLEFWMAGRPVPQTSLVRYIRENFVPSREVDNVKILVRKPTRST
jgi:hypothetical protein